MISLNYIRSSALPGYLKIPMASLDVLKILNRIPKSFKKQSWVIKIILFIKSKWIRTGTEETHFVKYSRMLLCCKIQAACRLNTMLYYEAEGYFMGKN